MALKVEIETTDAIC